MADRPAISHKDGIDEEMQKAIDEKVPIEPWRVPRVFDEEMQKAIDEKVPIQPWRVPRVLRQGILHLHAQNRARPCRRLCATN